MIQKIALIFGIGLCFATSIVAQRPMVAAPQSSTVIIKNAKIHTAASEPISQGAIVFKNGIITYIGKTDNLPNEAQATIIDALGKHVYPGLIALDSHLGLSEIESVRATRDFAETGTENPNVRALVAFNTDSKVIPTVRSNGVLLAQIAPQSATISGTASVVQLDAWNWEDAAVVKDNALFINWPEMMTFEAWWAPPIEIQREQREKDLDAINNLFLAAKGYLNRKDEQPNLKLVGLASVFNGGKKLFIRANSAKSILSALDFCRNYQIKPIIVGGAEASLVLSWLKNYSSGVVLGATHSLPRYAHSPISEPYQLPAILAENGIPFAITIEGYWQQRNLAFQAGTAIAHGLASLKALQAITLQAAAFAGVDKITGSLEVGKQANLLICNGDLLDMQSSIIEKAFIQGRAIDLSNSQKDLYRIYAEKYGIEPKP